MFFIYDIIISLVFVTTVLPWHLLLILMKRFTWNDLRQRLGTNRIPGRLKLRRILLHAVSVGEVTAAEPLTREILRTDPDIELVFTTGNTSGIHAAQRLQRLYPAIRHIQLLPWDELVTLSSWIRRLRPDMVLIVETELWPNFIRACGRLTIPVCIVNGRVYPRDVGRYRLIPRFLQHIFSHVNWIAVQSEREKKRFLAIGARLQQIEVMGNVKFDSSLPPLSESERVDTLWKAVPSFLVAGSTHHPEEHWLLESYRELRNDFPGLRLVLAPRNTSRAGAVEHLVRKSGLRPAQWSVSDKGPHNWDVLILDQTGWLPAFYARATAVIIGGSFANRGGHNLIEAAAQGRALIIGPHVQHFESIVEEFHRSEAILWLNSHRELTGALRSLLSDPNRRIDLGKKAGTLVESQRGVAQKYVRILMKKLGAGVFVPGNDRTTISFSQEKGPVHS